MVASALWILAVVAAVSLFILRPQRKRHNERALMLGAVGRGDEVFTSDGVHARVRRVNDDGAIELDCWPDGARLTVALDDVERVVGYDARKRRAELKRRSRKGRG